jgi:hypothetical protein
MAARPSLVIDVGQEESIYAGRVIKGFQSVRQSARPRPGLMRHSFGERLLQAASACRADTDTLFVVGATDTTDASLPEPFKYSGSYKTIPNHPCNALLSTDGSTALWFSTDRLIAFLGPTGTLSNNCPVGVYYVLMQTSFFLGTWTENLHNAGVFQKVQGNKPTSLAVRCLDAQTQSLINQQHVHASHTFTSDSRSVAVVALVIGLLSIVLACCGLVFLCGFWRRSEEKSPAARGFAQRGVKVKTTIPRAKKASSALDL